MSGLPSAESRRFSGLRRLTSTPEFRRTRKLRRGSNSLENKIPYSLKDLILYFLKLGYSGFAVFALLYIKKIREPYIILAAAVIGLILKTMI